MLFSVKNQIENEFLSSSIDKYFLALNQVDLENDL